MQLEAASPGKITMKLPVVESEQISANLFSCFAALFGKKLMGLMSQLYNSHSLLFKRKQKIGQMAIKIFK